MKRHIWAESVPKSTSEEDAVEHVDPLPAKLEKTFVCMLTYFVRVFHRSFHHFIFYFVAVITVSIDPCALDVLA